MRRTRVLALAVAGVVASSLVAATSGTGAPPLFAHLNPGGPPTLVERLPVNVVFVGYTRQQVDAKALLQLLPRGHSPVVYSRGRYGKTERIGITHRYEYHLLFTDTQYEDRFFARLTRLAQDRPLTQVQRDYNAQDNNVRLVRDNHHIDAPSVERWLAYNPPGGIDTRQNTVFYINWLGRGDFVHHVYTKTDEPDPDTGFNFGVQGHSRKIVAWGGTTADDEESGMGSTRRVWFHDLSAGPELWAGNWNVDDGDLDEDGRADYRIPVAWEYGPGAYRPRSVLTADLARLTRYVVLDLLFTASPDYPVEIPLAARQLPQTVDLDSNTYEAMAGVNASRRFIKPSVLVSELADLLPRTRFSFDSQDLPFRGLARRCFALYLRERRCFGDRNLPAFGNLFLQNTDQIRRTRDDTGRVDHELAIFNYAMGPRFEPVELGFADDNWVDGSQTYVFAFLSRDIIDRGSGLTTTLIHEVGHHFGLGHPTDGYDSRSGVHFHPTGRFYFAMAGDECNSVMSTISLNWDFSQFDRDNMLRFQTAAYIEAANLLAGEALAAPRPYQAHDDLRAADRHVGQAREVFATNDYPKALELAARAHAAAVQGAREAGVDVAALQREMQPAAAAARTAQIHQPGGLMDILGAPRVQP